VTAAAQLVAGADAEAFVGSAAEPLSVVQDALVLLVGT
jgi:hypothetical protein